MKRAILVLSLVCVPTAIAWADGFMTAPRAVLVERSGGQMVRSPRQEAVLLFSKPTVRVILRTHFRAGPKDVAWIIPVPETPCDVGEADPAIFSALDRATAPRFQWVVRYAGLRGTFGGGFGTGNAADSGGVEERKIIIEASGTAGIFEWTAIDAKDAAKLIEWLTANNYAVPPGAEPIIRLYVKEQWHWLAVKVRPGEARKPTLAPHPLAYTYTAHTLIYPLTISQLSADADNEILLYVVAPGRAFTKNWGSGAVDGKALKRDHDSPSGTNYEALLRRMTEDAGGRLFVTEFAGDLMRGENLTLREHMTRHAAFHAGGPVTFLTRLRAVMKPKAMTRDVIIRAVAAHRPLTNVFMVKH